MLKRNILQKNKNYRKEGVMKSLWWKPAKKQEEEMSVIFQHLYEEVFACLGHKHFGTDSVIFPQNFIPVPGQRYNSLNIVETITGEYVFGNKVYHVYRAYHPDYDNGGNLIQTTASIIEKINFQADNKDRKAKMGNGFAGLAKMRESLPQKKKKESGCTTPKYYGQYNWQNEIHPLWTYAANASQAHRHFIVQLSEKLKISGYKLRCYFSGAKDNFIILKLKTH
jgi:hypothetical protein